MNGLLAWTIVPAPRAFVEGHVAAVHESGNGTKPTFRDVRLESVVSAKADKGAALNYRSRASFRRPQ
jgi:hypothetical protein